MKDQAKKQMKLIESVRHELDLHRACGCPLCLEVIDVINKQFPKVAS